ncbi:hypothetical protein QU38_00095, partial [Staphylococcus aureus]
DIGGDLGILARAGAQFGIPVRIAQEAHVEHQVGVAREPAGKTERDDRDHRVALAGARESGADLLGEFVGAEIGGVDQPVRPASQRREQFALVRDAVLRRAILGHRMASARLRIAPFQFGARAFEEQR